MSIPVLDLEQSEEPGNRVNLLEQLRDALFNVGFLYITNHGVKQQIIDALATRLPALFALSTCSKAKLTKLNSPHFLGYSGFAEETTLGKEDLREQFDFATELPALYNAAANKIGGERDFSKLYWKLRGPNQWPDEDELPGFRQAWHEYHESLSELSYHMVHLIEEAFNIPPGTFDSFFGHGSPATTTATFLPPQHRMKLVKYPVTQVSPDGSAVKLGVGAHRDSSGLLTLLYQVGNEPGLEVLDKNGRWISATPITGAFVVNFGHAFEAATEGTVRATVHRVRTPTERARYSILFFMGLPLDMTISQIRDCMPAHVKAMKREHDGHIAADEAINSFLDPRWDSLGESQLRKWIRSHREVGIKWYGKRAVDYYTSLD